MTEAHKAIAVGWALFGFLMLWRATRKGAPPGMTHLPDLGERLEPLTFIPKGSPWRRSETP